MPQIFTKNLIEVNLLAIVSEHYCCLEYSVISQVYLIISFIVLNLEVTLSSITTS